MSSHEVATCDRVHFESMQADTSRAVQDLLPKEYSPTGKYEKAAYRVGTSACAMHSMPGSSGSAHIRMLVACLQGLIVILFPATPSQKSGWQ